MDTMESSAGTGPPHLELMSSASGAKSPKSPRSPKSRRSNKPKRPPPITPKRFQRFFTPRTSASQADRLSRSNAGRQLRDITRSGVNRNASTRRTLKQPQFQDQENVLMSTPPHRHSARLKRSLPSPATSPVQHSSPCKRVRISGPEDDRHDSFDIPSSPPLLPEQMLEEIEEETELEDNVSERCPSPVQLLCKPIRRMNIGSQTARLAERSFGGGHVLGKGRRRDPPVSGVDRLSDFCTLQNDQCRFQRARELPFCTATGNTDSIVATGTESGSISLMDSSPGSDFNKKIVTFANHPNAIMDMAFSSDDSMLATASGDQTCRVIDTRTQQTKAVFSYHRSSCKQVRFRPGDDNVIATCSRDGIVSLWDQRCRGEDQEISEDVIPYGSPIGSDFTKRHDATFHYDPFHLIKRAHMDRQALQVMNSNGTRDEPKGQTTRNGDVSVTALSFLSGDRSHLLLSGSEASTSIKLWDIRARYSRRSAALPTPVSSTMTPQSHQRYRNYGITSFTLNTNESILYSLARDNTLYAFKTSHLILGHAPELDPGSNTISRLTSEGRQGLDPIYGFRHPNLYTTSFYVKAALRPAKNDKCELIAVGSGHQSRCAILFSTDLADFGAPINHKSSLSSGLSSIDNSLPSSRPTTPRLGAGSSRPVRDSIPIYEGGTTLDHAHSKEITSVNWTGSGDLVTLSDDFTCRVWREDGKQARALRRAREGAPEVFGAGWAAVREGWDDDE